MLSTPGCHGLSRKESAASYFRQKLTPRKKSLRARTLPELPALKCVAQPNNPNLHAQNIHESPQTVLNNVSEYFLNEVSKEVCSYPDGDASIHSTQASSDRPSSKVGKDESSMPVIDHSAYPDPCQILQGESTSGQKASGLLRSKSLLQFSSPSKSNFPTCTTASNHSRKSDPLPVSQLPHFVGRNAPLKKQVNYSSKSDPRSVSPYSLSDEHVSSISKHSRAQSADVNAESLPITSKILGKKKAVEPDPAIDEKSELTGFLRPQAMSARDYLQKGIEAHQNGQMKQSAVLFEQCAKEDGGCGVGMLMWALALRHGWGCQVDTIKAFGWLQLAAETLLRELHQLKIEKERYVELHCSHLTNGAAPASQEMNMKYIALESKGIISELLLALYELGQCLMQGWGCKKDKSLAVEYYKLAATLGDADAQKELAYCYEVGKGIKKSSRSAARYYRMACAQGIKMMGYQWIWKEKYNAY